MPKQLRSYIIESHQVGTNKYTTKKQQEWGIDGALPPEWRRVKEDPRVDQAQIYTNAQRRWRADRRRILDHK